ncbi:hypothetical protein BN1708_018193, partial [Verticillium longisporum]
AQLLHHGPLPVQRHQVRQRRHHQARQRDGGPLLLAHARRPARRERCVRARPVPTSRRRRLVPRLPVHEPAQHHDRPQRPADQGPRKQGRRGILVRGGED